MLTARSTSTVEIQKSETGVSHYFTLVDIIEVNEIE